MSDTSKAPAVEVGKTYAVDHSRKGRFQLKVTKVNDEWVYGTVVEGVAAAQMEYNMREVGESVTLRREFASFREVT